MSGKTEKEKVSYLMTYIGDKGREVYLTFDWRTITLEDGTRIPENDTLEGVYRHYEAYVKPKKNQIRATVNFHRRKQKEGERFHDFVTDLKLLVRDCGYDDNDRMMRDAIVLNALSQDVRQKCLERGDELTLDMAINIGQTSETAQESIRAIDQEVDKVHALRASHKRGQTKPSHQGRPQKGKFKGQNPSKGKHSKPNDDKCKRCGYHANHPKCPAIGQLCAICKKPNHFAAVCRKGTHTHMVVENETASTPDEGLDDESGQDYAHLFAVSENESQGHSANDWYETVSINEQKHRVQIDTGSAHSIMPVHIYHKLKDKPSLQQASRRFVTYSNHTLELAGSTKLSTTYKDRTVDVLFHVVKADSKPILLSGSDSARLDLIQRLYNIDEYPELKGNTGTLPGTCTLKIDPTHKPVIHAPRRQPQALAMKIKAKLKEMEDDGHIAKVHEPTDWVNSMVVVVKKDKIRICIDPKDLNKAIRREHYPIPTVEEVIASMPDAHLFSVIDAKSGFLQIKLDYESSLLTTFNTPQGRYRWLRLPFGIKSAPEIFQRIMDEMLEGIQGARAIMDDILIAGKDKKQHDEILKKVVQRAKQYNLKLNAEKCKIRQREVKYVGHIISSSGLKPDPEKVKALREMAAPTSKQAVQQFLGLVQYLAKFIPDLSTVDQPIRALTTKDAQFQWGPSQQKSFDKLKELCTTAPVLAFYDVKKDVVIQCDASSYALGGVLLQEGRPVAYTSRALTETESRYAQIEKEMLAIVHSCRKFHHYVFGKTVHVESDHKPLQAIFRKPLLSAPMRLQGMLLRLQPYDLVVEYKPGKEIPIGDALSRANLPESDPDIEPVVVNMLDHIAVSQERYTKFQSCTAMELNELHSMIMRGWPDTKQEVPHAIREYWTIRDELSVSDGVIYKGMRIVVPPSMRRQLLETIHESHLGIVKSKQRAREALYWPAMNQQIEEMIEDCTECNTHQKAQHTEPLHPTPHPDLPWQEAASDLFEWEGSHYLLTIDYYSKYIEVTRLTTTTSSAVVHALKEHFSRHGIPEILRTDNGPQYVAAEFATFCKDWGITHRTSSPHHPKSNGEAERGVQTIKSLWKKCKDKNLALLDYRTTPLASCNLSPAQLSMGRRPRNKLPAARRLLSPKLYQPTNVKQRLDAEKERQAYYYNSKAGQNLPALHPGDPVRMAPLPGTKRWLPATIEERHRSPRSYVLNHNGRKYRRNRKHIRLATHEANRERSGETTIIPETWFQSKGGRSTPVPVSRPAPQQKEGGPASSPSDSPRPPERASRPAVSTHTSATAAYTTRSGRTVKTPDRLNL